MINVALWEIHTLCLSRERLAQQENQTIGKQPHKYTAKNIKAFNQPRFAVHNLHHIEARKHRPVSQESQAEFNLIFSRRARPD